MTLEESLSSGEIAEFRSALSNDSKGQSSAILTKGIDALFETLQPSEALEWIEAVAPGSGDSMVDRKRPFDGKDTASIIDSIRHEAPH